MDPAHSPLIECRHCGNSERMAKWDRSVDLTCTMCRAVILPADPALAAQRAARLTAEEAANTAKDPMKRLHRLTGSLAKLGIDPLADDAEDEPAPAPPPAEPAAPKSPRLVDQVLELKAKRLAEEAAESDEGDLFSEAESPDWEGDRDMIKRAARAGNEEKTARRRRRKKWALKQQGAAGPGSGRLPAWTGQVMAGVGGVLMAGLLLWLVISILSSRSRSVGPAGTGAADGGASGSDKIIRIARQFAEATTTEDRLKLVRDPAKAKPLIEAYHPTIGFGKLQQIRPFGGGTDGTVPYEIFMATYDDEHSRLVCVLTTPDGPQVDWEAFSRQGTVTPEQLADGTARKGEVRVLGSPSNYFNYRFNDDKKWLALQLSNSDWKDSLTGYALIGSPQAEILRRIWKDPRMTFRLLLEVETDGDSGSQAQVAIKRVLALGWVRGSVAADEAVGGNQGASEISTSLLPPGSEEAPASPSHQVPDKAAGPQPAHD